MSLMGSPKARTIGKNPREVSPVRLETSDGYYAGYRSLDEEMQKVTDESGKIQIFITSERVTMSKRAITGIAIKFPHKSYISK